MQKSYQKFFGKVTLISKRKIDIKNVYLTAEYREKEKGMVNKKWWKDKIKSARIWSSGKILELGCGEFPIFNNSTKVDIYPFKNYIIADCNKPLPIFKKFDTIIALDLIEHLYDVNTFLRECNRLLKTNGILILSTPNVKSWRNRLKLFFGKTDFYEMLGVDLHLQNFSPETLVHKVESFGFILEDIKPIGRLRLLNFCGVFIAKFRKQ